MEPWVALLRGINVGGRNSLPMQGLVRVLQALGAHDVKTYIQSGNAVLWLPAGQGAQWAPQLAARIQQEWGFAPGVLLLPLAALDQAIANNPYPQAQAQPTAVHLGFLAQQPTHAQLDAMATLKAVNEAFQLQGQVWYLHAPDGIGRSRLAARAEALLGVAMTLRNWRTVCALQALARP